MNAKQQLNEIAKIIDQKLADYWEKEMKLNFGFNESQQVLVKNMLFHASEHNLRQAKRIRGAFVYYGYLLGQEKHTDDIWNPVMSLELVHTALLMHDDVMDQDDTRRGKPTTHKFFGKKNDHYGESMAYTIGDAVLTLGYQLLSDAAFEPSLIQKATSRLLRGVVNTAYGQAYDVTLEMDTKVWTEEHVIALHKAKTAIYTYENPLIVGAILAGLSGEVFDILHRYSMSGGVGFQLQDDILGVFGNPEQTGKSADSDLLQGKRTLLVQKAFEFGSAAQQTIIKKVWGKRRADKKDIDAAKKVIRETGSLEYSVKLSKQLAREAAQEVEQLRVLNYNTEAIDFIQGIATYLAERDL